MIAALYVDPKGVYANDPRFDCWDEERDARLYDGPHPVVAHPPCSRWCRLAGLVEARWGHKRGEDGGCFSSALESVRRWGGVLEHPAHTDAWAAHELPNPGYRGWQATICGGWVCYVEQGRYGHLAKKGTWLYALGGEPPSLRWGWRRDTDCDWDAPRDHYKRKADGQPQALALVSWCGNHVKSGDVRPRLGKRAAKATPPEFRDELVRICQAVSAREALA